MKLHCCLVCSYVQTHSIFWTVGFKTTLHRVERLYYNLNISEFIVELNRISGVITTKIPCYYVTWSLVSPFLRNLNMHISRCSRPGPGSRVYTDRVFADLRKVFHPNQIWTRRCQSAVLCYPPPVLAICICNFISINEGKK